MNMSVSAERKENDLWVGHGIHTMVGAIRYSLGVTGFWEGEIFAVKLRVGGVSPVSCQFEVDAYRRTARAKTEFFPSTGLLSSYGQGTNQKFPLDSYDGGSSSLINAAEAQARNLSKERNLGEERKASMRQLVKKNTCTNFTPSAVRIARRIEPRISNNASWACSEKVWVFTRKLRGSQ